jgi:acyl-coenzyme A thioesterase PaaI-like protein
MTADMVWDADGHFVLDLGFGAGRDGDEFVGAMQITPELCTPGTDHVRVGALITLADCTAGPLAARISMPSLALTLDLTYTAIGRPPADVVHARAAVRKTGRATTFTETLLTDSAGVPFGSCLGTFVSSPRPQDALLHDPVEILSRPTVAPAVDGLLPDHMGIRLVAPGVAELHRHPKVLNQGQTLQGGAVAILAEIAAQSAASEAVGAPMVVTELDVRYLATYRVGPGRATAEPLVVGGDGGPTTVRVEVRDAGRDDRLGTVALARCLPAARFAAR